MGLVRRRLCRWGWHCMWFAVVFLFLFGSVVTSAGTWANSPDHVSGACQIYTEFSFSSVNLAPGTTLVLAGLVTDVHNLAPGCVLVAEVENSTIFGSYWRLYLDSTLGPASHHWRLDLGRFFNPFRVGRTYQSQLSFPLIQTAVVSQSP